MNNSNLSIFDENTGIDLFNYGSLLFPLCIYEKHGGWGAIKRVFEYYTDKSSYLDLIGGSYNGAGYNYESIFSEMAIANVIPKDSELGYSIAGALDSSDVIWPSAPITQMALTSVDNGYIAPLSSKYYKYSAVGNAGTLYITAESYDPLSFYILQEQIKKHVITDDSGVYRATFVSENFGLSPSNDNIIVVVTNTMTSGSDSSYTVLSTCD